MTTLGRLTFAALVLATLGAFFVTQRLKRSPPVIAHAQFSPPSFSPDGDGVHDQATVVFRVKRADDVSVSVIDAQGDAVRELASGRSVAGGVPVAIRWNGREDDGRLAPGGRYRVRLVLAKAGRSVFLPGVVSLDTSPPSPRILKVAGRTAAAQRLPLIVRAGHATPVTVRFGGAAAELSTLVVSRTDLAHPRVVARARVPGKAFLATWDGRVTGPPTRPAPPGVYRLQIRASDAAGNTGISPARAPGIGVTVRGVAVQPPLGAHAAGRPLTFLVDSRGRPYRWAIRAVGSGAVLRRGRHRGFALHVRAPSGPSCACRMTVTAGRTSTTVPFAVTSAKHHAVLVVLPSLSWAADDPGDDDGDGIPNTLSRGQPAPLRRPFAGLPAGFADGEARLMAHLDDSGDAYDLTTDTALALGSGPTLAGHRGVLLAGVEEWLPANVRLALRRFVVHGGRLASFSAGSLRRGVTLTSGAGPALVHPGRLGATDALSSRFGPVVHRQEDLTVFRQGTGLFDTVSGVFPKWPAWEPTRSVAPGTLRAFAGPDPQTPVIVAYSLGRGLVMRAGLPGWAGRLGHDPTVTDLTDQAWLLLSR